MNVQAAGWFPDPMQRHQFRWWTGAGWSEHVSDGGVSGVDPLSNQAPAQSTVAQAPPLERSVPYAQQPQYPQQPQFPQQPQYPQQPQPYHTVIGPPPVTAVTSNRSAIGWITLVGAVVAGASALLNWLDLGPAAVNGLDVPAAFLADYQTVSDNTFSVGILVFVAAALALIAAFVRQPAMRVVGMAAGGALVLIGVVYIVQLSRLADDADVSLGDVFGIGPAATIVGGLAVLVAAGR